MACEEQHIARIGSQNNYKGQSLWAESHTGKFEVSASPLLVVESSRALSAQLPVLAPVLVGSACLGFQHFVQEQLIGAVAHTIQATGILGRACVCTVYYLAASSPAVSQLVNSALQWVDPWSSCSVRYQMKET